MLKHVFFDLDNTLMLSRTVMAPEHQSLFRKLCDEKDVIVVSGAQASQIKAQIPDSIGAQFYILAQTGNQALGKDGAKLWEEAFSKEQTDTAISFIDAIKTELNLVVKDPNDLIELRGSQISYSPIGHHEQLEKKYAFDPDQSMRRGVIAKHAGEVEKLHAVGIDVVPGGTTCFDFFLAGKNKGYNVARLIEREEWNKEDTVYVGDALFPGGNDETVVGVVPTQAVKDPHETFDWISKLLTQ